MGPWGPLPPGSHRQTEAAAALGAPELAEGLLDGAGGVESLSEQQDAIEEEKGRQAVDHVLEVLDAGRGEARSSQQKRTGWRREERKNDASLTRLTESQSPERCGRSTSPPTLRFGSTLHARSHKTAPCRHSTAGWPPGRGRALPQCTGYSNHNNLRGHNISAHRRHTPHIQAHNTFTPQWGVSVSQWGNL